MASDRKIHSAVRIGPGLVFGPGSEDALQEYLTKDNHETLVAKGAISGKWDIPRKAKNYEGTRMTSSVVTVEQIRGERAQGTAQDMQPRQSQSISLPNSPGAGATDEDEDDDDLSDFEGNTPGASEQSNIADRLARGGVVEQSELQEAAKEGLGNQGAGGTPLPSNFAKRQTLIAGGYDTLEKIASASQRDLEALPQFGREDARNAKAHATDKLK
jgi:hypothetical protein